MSIKVPPFYIDHIAATLEAMGVSEKKWLASCDVSSAVSASHSMWLPVEQYIALISKAVELSIFPDIGLRVGQRLGIGSHGMLGFALLNCRDLEQAITILNRYISTRTPLLQTDIRQQGADVSILLRPMFELPGARRAFLETVTVTFCNLFVMLSPQPYKNEVLKNVCFDFETPNYANRYKDCFSVKCEFNAPVCEIVLNSVTLNRHFNQADAVALRHMLTQFEQQLLQEPVADNTSAKARVLKVVEAEHHRLPTLEEVAQVLLLTPRTLHRRLKREGTSYRELLATAKKQRAIQYLDHSDMTIQHIAWSLGYDDVANFRRAFKNWTGTTPQKYKSRHDNRREHGSV